MTIPRLTISTHRNRRALLKALLALPLAGCMVPEPAPLAGQVLPAYVIPLGASREDVLGMLGPPPVGPRFDLITHQTEIIYRFPQPILQAQTRMPDGTQRIERTDTVYLFFGQGGRLERIDLRPNPYYSAFPGTLAHQVTVMPRIRGLDGRIRPLGPTS